MSQQLESVKDFVELNVHLVNVHLVNFRSGNPEEEEKKNSKRNGGNGQMKSSEDSYFLARFSIKLLSNLCAAWKPLSDHQSNR